MKRDALLVEINVSNGPSLPFISSNCGIQIMPDYKSQSPRAEIY